MSTATFLDCLAVVCPPAIAALVVGLTCRVIPKRLAHTLTILGVFISCVFSFKIFMVYFHGALPVEYTAYDWMHLGSTRLQIGFFVDKLTSLMLVVVTSISLLVHIYTIGYMEEDPGYARFFSHISLFTFSMLMLVMANNFLQLFFGWEAVGLVSYLLIGFWHHKPSAVVANIKAFLVNRVGDFGFLLGIAGVYLLFGSLDYNVIFEKLPAVAAAAPYWMMADSIIPVPALTIVTLLLFVGAMGKSAQAPLHVWLPDSMEGPTPISALIHAATMVTAGVFMVTRMAPLFEVAPITLNTILIIGTFTSFAMGLLGLVQHDIKRVVAYSTLSQLGYMVAGLGVSAYEASMFHLATHAFFKALLFLGAGSVIIALHHEQDIRRMGGLSKRLPITYACMWVATLALIGLPGCSGFYSKDLIIDAVQHSSLSAAPYAYVALLSGVLVTTLYSFRLLHLVFHGTPRMSPAEFEHAHEPRWVVWLPLVILAIPSAFLGWWMFESVTSHQLLGDVYAGITAQHPGLSHVYAHFTAEANTLHIFLTPAFALIALGFVLSLVCYRWFTQVPAQLAQFFAWPYRILLNKYGFDEWNHAVLVNGIRKLGVGFWQYGDRMLIDKGLVHGLAHKVSQLARLLRRMHSGYLYHYVFSLLLGLVLLLGLLLICIQ
ncbi:MAG: NADH-quinone oxidoreductase subunit L [Pseudomonadota bacterium]